jgi:RNA polymerase sigma-70 factor (ECF subfamily)
MALSPSDTSPPLSSGSTSSEWLDALRSSGRSRDGAVQSLHGLLLRAARFEVSRRRGSLAHVRGEELDDLATQAADDAVVAVLAKLDTFRGASRFTTWAYKFALLEAGVRLRRRAWQEREVVLDSESWTRLGAEGGPAPEADAERAELLSALSASIGQELTEHQRLVLVALAIDGVPIDVLAERLDTTRGALYKTLHDARRKLRAALADKGFAVEEI